MNRNKFTVMFGIVLLAYSAFIQVQCVRYRGEYEEITFKADDRIQLDASVADASTFYQTADRQDMRTLMWSFAHPDWAGRLIFFSLCGDGGNKKKYVASRTAHHRWTLTEVTRQP